MRATLIALLAVLAAFVGLVPSAAATVPRVMLWNPGTAQYLTYNARFGAVELPSLGSQVTPRSQRFVFYHDGSIRPAEASSRCLIAVSEGPGPPALQVRAFNSNATGWRWQMSHGLIRNVRSGTYLTAEDPRSPWVGLDWLYPPALSGLQHWRELAP